MSIAGQARNYAPCTISRATYYSIGFWLLTAYLRNLNLHFAKIPPDPRKKKIGKKILSENHLFSRNFGSSQFFLFKIKKPKASRRDEILSVIWGKMQICAHACVCSVMRVGVFSHSRTFFFRCSMILRFKNLMLRGAKSVESALAVQGSLKPHFKAFCPRPLGTLQQRWPFTVNNQLVQFAGTHPRKKLIV